MNCQRFDLLASELARGQMMEADLRGEALAHAGVCEDCSVRLRDEETLTGSLKSLAAEMASLNAPAEIELQLRKAFRARAVVTPVSRKYYWVAAVAAVVLVVVSVIAMRWRTDTPNQIRAQQNEQPRTKEEPPVVKEQKFVEAQPRAPEIALKPRRRSVRRAPTSEVANHVNREIATDFMPLGYLNPATLQDGGRIVRVEVPRSALVNFGLPVNMDRYHEKVKADVLLGVDGLAHAIRFVK